MAAVGALVLFGCPSNQVDRLDYPYEVDAGGAEAAGEGAETGAEGAVDTGPTLRLAGDPCEEDADCLPVPGQCFTTDYLTKLGLAYEVPDGMCSKLSCSADADCGAGAVCFDSTPFSGAPIKVCLHVCHDAFDCRYAGGYNCFGTGAAGETMACLPDAIIAAIRCGDKVCDEQERTNGSCPEDCK